MRPFECTTCGAAFPPTVGASTLSCKILSRSWSVPSLARCRPHIQSFVTFNRNDSSMSSSMQCKSFNVEERHSKGHTHKSCAYDLKTLYTYFCVYIYTYTRMYVYIYIYRDTCICACAHCAGREVSSAIRRAGDTEACTIADGAP